MLKIKHYLALAVFGVVAALPAVAGASTTDPSLDVADFAGDAVGLMFPIVIALVAAGIAIAVLMFGVRKTFGFIRRGGSVR